MGKKRLPYHGDFLFKQIVAAAGHNNHRKLEFECFRIEDADGTRLSRWKSRGIQPSRPYMNAAAEFIFSNCGSSGDLSSFRREFFQSYDFLKRLDSGAARQHPDMPDLAKYYLREIGEFKLDGDSRAEEGFRNFQQSKTAFRLPQPLPIEFINRNQKYEQLKEAILSGDVSNSSTNLTILCGFGGFGKTVLAKQIYCDPEVLEQFSDGVFWIQCRKSEPLSPETLIPSLLSQIPLGINTYSAATARLELINVMTDKRVLLIVDDVWYDAHVEIFRNLPAGCGVLITTRMQSLILPNMKRVHVEEMRPIEALNLIGFNLNGAHDPSELSRAELEKLKYMCRKLGYWPQLIALANGRLRRHCKGGFSILEAADSYLTLLEEKGIVIGDARDHSGSNARARAISLCIDASLELLTRAERSRIVELGILPSDPLIPLQAITDYWNASDGISSEEGRELLFLFAEMSLLQITPGSTVGVSVHDNLLDYFHHSIAGGDLKRLHGAMLDGISTHCCGGWDSLAVEHSYGWKNLLFHLEQAGRKSEAHSCMTDFHWLKRKLAAVGPHELVYGFLPATMHPELATIGHAVACSLPALASYPASLAHQLFGRLGHSDDEMVAKLISNVRIDPDFWPVPANPHLPPAVEDVFQFHVSNDPVIDTHWNYDEQKIIVCGASGELNIFDQNGIFVNELPPNRREGVFSTFYDQDNDQLLLARRNGIITIREVGRPASDHEILYEPLHNIRNVGIQQSKGQIVAVSEDRKILRIDRTSRKLEINHVPFPQSVYLLSLDSQCLRTAVVSRPNRLLLSDIREGEFKVIQRFVADESFSCISFGFRDQLLLTASEQHAYVLIVPSLEILRKVDLCSLIDVTTEVVSEMAVFADGENLMLAIGTTSGRVVVFEVDDDSISDVLWTLSHEGTVTALRFSGDGRKLLSASVDGTVSLSKRPVSLTASIDQRSRRSKAGKYTDKYGKLKNLNSFTHFVEVSRDLHKIFIQEFGERPFISFNFESSQDLNLSTEGSTCRSACFSPLGDVLAYSFLTNGVGVYFFDEFFDPNFRGTEATSERRGLSLTDLVFDDQEYFFGGIDKDGHLQLFNACCLDTTFEAFQFSGSGVSCIALNLVADRMVAIDKEENLHLWCLSEGGKAIQICKLAAGTSSQVFFEPSGSKVAIVHERRTISIWCLNGGAEIGRVHFDQSVRILSWTQFEICIENVSQGDRYVFLTGDLH